WVSCRPSLPPRFPYTTLFRSRRIESNEQRELKQHRETAADGKRVLGQLKLLHLELSHFGVVHRDALFLKSLYLVLDLLHLGRIADRKSTRLNSSHVKISYAVF